MTHTYSRLTGLSILIICLLGSSAALANNNVNGSIHGIVTSNDNPVENAEITVRNLDTNAVKTTETSKTGTFSFSQIVPGKYEVTTSSTGYKSLSSTTTVYSGKGSSIHFKLEFGDMEDVLVTASAKLAFDVKSVEKSTVLTAAEVEQLPVSRNIESVALLIPGTMSGDVSFGNLVSFSGSSVAENVYYINGMNVTDFRRGLGGSAIPFEFFDQFQFKSGGFSAEYGRSTGGVLSGTTRRGKSSWSARMGYTTTPEIFRSYNPDIPHPTEDGEFVSLASVDKSYATQYFLSAGGPVVENRIYIHAIYQGRDYQTDDFTDSDRFNRSTSEDPFWGGKLDWIINDFHRLELTVFSDERTSVTSSHNWDRLNGEIGTHRGDNFSNRGGRNYIGNYIGTIGRNFILSLLSGRNQYDRTNYSALDDLCPAAYDSRDGQPRPIGCWTNLSTGSSLDTRELYRVDIEFNLGYRHRVRFGLDHETNSSEDSRRYSGPNGGEYFRYYSANSGSTLDNGGIVPDGVTAVVRHRLYRRGGSFKTTASALYIEDLWDIFSNVSARLGIRNESFNNRNALDETFIKMTNQWALRLGIVWDVRANGKSRLFLNTGRYHLPIANNTNVRLAGSELFTQDWYTLGSAIAQDGSVVLGNKIGQTSVFGDGSVQPADEVLDTTIEPMYQDEFIVGFEAELWQNFKGGLSYIYRNLGRAIEDITIDEAIGLPGEFHYILTNPGTDVRTRYDVDGDGISELIELSAAELGYPTPVRKYHSLTLAVKRSWNRGSYLDATYTWSHSYGNYEGLVRSDNGQSDAGITTLFDFAGLMEGAYGNLPNDRRHSLKVFGVYKFRPRWQCSFSTSYVHGRPRNAFGIHPTDPHSARYGSASFYRQGTFTPRGSLGRTEGIFNVDLGLQLDRTIWTNALQIKLDVFNVFDTNGILEVREVADQQTGAASPTFGLPAAFQRPRTVRISIKYDIHP
ncbi:MAG: TonB-dependent receptor [Gammaproteobacteria bacterium]|nr:TonB-dependent receptor [Gammaproteobacteria bacterium]MYF02658.1 TonB-dependent receptor [Gammaproteobacteria bacterium]